MPDDRTMAQGDRLDQAIIALRDAAIPEGPPPEVLARILAAPRGAWMKPRAIPVLDRLRGLGPIIRFAAAVLVAGALGLVALMTWAHFGTGIAFADMLERVRAARTVSYTMRVGDEPAPTRVLVMEPGHIRMELPDGRVNILDEGSGKGLVLDPAQRRAMVIELKTTDGQARRSEDQIGWLRRFKGRPDEELGERKVDDRLARGFRVTEGGRKATVWADAKTGFPVRIESTFGYGPLKDRPLVIGDITFDTPLDDALFRLTPPPGYSAWTRELPMTPPVERDLVALLRAYTQLSGGAFPPDLQAQSLVQVVRPKDPKTGLDPKSRELMMTVGRGLGLVWSLPADADLHYAGRGVKLGEADKPVFWYRPRESRRYRVIFGDLNTREVEKDELPK